MALQTFPIVGLKNGQWSSDSKRPAVKWRGYLGGHGYNEYYGISVPEHNIIIDIDLKGHDLQYYHEALNKLSGEDVDWSKALLQHTPSGGAHYVFKVIYEGRLDQRQIMPNVDTRIGGKGYIATGPNYKKLRPITEKNFDNACVLPIKFLEILAVDEVYSASHASISNEPIILHSYDVLEKWCHRIAPKTLDSYDDWIVFSLAMKRLSIDNPEYSEAIKDLWNEISESFSSYDQIHNDKIWLQLQPSKASLNTIKRFAINSMSWWLPLEIESGVPLDDLKEEILQLPLRKSLKYQAIRDYGLSLKRNINVIKPSFDKYVGETLKYTKDYIDFVLSKYEMKETAKSALFEFAYDLSVQKSTYWYHFKSKRYYNKTNVKIFLSRLTIIDKKSGEVVDPYSVLEKIIQYVHGVKYEPNMEQIFIEDDMVYANTYVPTIFKSDEGSPSNAVVDRHNTHLDVLFSKKKERDLFQYQLARIIKRKTKTGMAVLLQGAQGCGKTYFKHFFEAILGLSNVKAVDYRKILESQFDDWKVGSIVNCLEEVKPEGKYVSYFAERLKEVITADYFSVERKHCPSVTMKNHCNYFAFTNHQDAVALEQFDRRWFVMKCDQQSKRDVDRIFEKYGDDYFTLLFNDLKESAHILYDYYMKMELPKEEESRVTAPISDAKVYLTKTNRSMDDIEVSEFIQDVILSDFQSKDVFVTKNHVDAIRLLKKYNTGDAYKYPGRTPMKTKQFRAILNRLGWSHYKDSIYWHERYCIYYKEDFDKEFPDYELKSLINHSVIE